MLKVYVAGNYSADNVIDVLKNIGKGQKACADLFAEGFYPFCPWFDKDFIIQNPEIDFNVSDFQAASIAWLEVSDCMYVISGIGNGGGVDAEIDFATKKGIPVFSGIYALRDWAAKEVQVKG